MTEKEKEFTQGLIYCILNEGAYYVDFTGTTISPYNLREALKDNGFEEDAYDCNCKDYWWSFKHPNVGTVTMFFNAESFELTLRVDNDAKT